MAIIKCKMCGGDLVLIEGQSVAECEYCGSRQTVPSADNEKKLTLFARANRLRAACEFDKAAGIYESIVADFPEEAEAYWGLVLCKYGIEYVDDPASGKKIPTCHRSSFDSIMDDSNFEQAMENADEVALRIYRQEAKAIEEVRKGILEVSSSEKPYDIFICYKETDSKGDRTVDSLLAQDIYDALTSKGYRVFFSRITLEDKLGQAYEPYIFAALNSAKIMLAVGTCYEHYNAVWVKNEWSRYLKIVAQDKNKYLIPCYKNIDAYDIPKEFAHLQGQDMGKVGAISDLLRGIEKLVPLQKSSTVVIQEKVVVGGSGNNKIAALLERGNMALEDGDWAKADSFFEDVLNNDAKNAQAYIGKTLALERCRTMDALVRKRKDVYQNVSSETLFIDEKTAHIEQMAEQYSLHGYVSADSVRKLYEFDLSYLSEVSGRQKQYREEENWWQNHKQLSRAEKFAAGAVAEHLQSEKKHLFAQLAERVKKAQEANAKAIAKAEAAYDAHIAEADKRAEQLYNNGLAHREQHYQGWLSRAKEATNPSLLLELAEAFDDLVDYKDSKYLAEHCRKRAVYEQAKIDAENERKAEAARLEAEARAKRYETFVTITAVAVVLVIAVTMVVIKVIVPGNNYKAAVALMENGDYAAAAKAFDALGNYKDSQEQAKTMRVYVFAAEKKAEEERLAAEKKAEEERLAAEKKAEEARLAKEYAAAESLAAEGKYMEALSAFMQLDGYKDSAAKLQKILEQIAVRETISAGWYHTVGLKPNGTVVAVGYNEHGQCDLDSWTDIVAISAATNLTVGLKVDGSVVATGDNTCGECDVSGWTDIVAISAAGSHTVGLKKDGTVVATQYTGDKEYYYGQCEVLGWTDIIAVGAGGNHTIGLKADGTVVAVGDNSRGQCNVDSWTDIVAISAGSNHTVGLKADGTVVAVGNHEGGQCNVDSWTDIVAISAGSSHTVGLKADGTVVAVGDKNFGHCDVSSWRNIVAIDAGVGLSVGLKKDGTVVVSSNNAVAKIDVSDWRNIKIPR